jgi:hypothetical protein
MTATSNVPINSREGRGLAMVHQPHNILLKFRLNSGNLGAEEMRDLPEHVVDFLGGLDGNLVGLLSAGRPHILKSLGNPFLPLCIAAACHGAARTLGCLDGGTRAARAGGEGQHARKEV